MKTYTSVFSWRYGSDAMRAVWSESHKYAVWRRIWIALASAQKDAGLVTAEELEDLVANEKNIDINKILEEEKLTRHDVVAAIREFAGKAKRGGGKIHLGATSMDIVDNADAIRVRESIEIIETKLKKLLHLFARHIEKYADTPCIGYTHLQPAEPTTVGYRLAFYAQDLLTDFELLQFVKKHQLAKGLKGATGTQAGYVSLLSSRHSGKRGTSASRIDVGSSTSQDDKPAGTTVEDFEQKVMQKLGIEAVEVSSQVAPRKIDYLVLTLLASISSSLAKFAGDLRILQSPPIGEWSEPFATGQVGSSAMPYKKNPINSEKICSLARYLEALPAVSLGNATHSYLERTLDDSANKRIIVPEAFLAVDEILETAAKIVEGLIINEKKVAYNLAQYAPFVATEAIIIEAVKKGADRQAMHELLREISLKAWEVIQEGKPNPMRELLLADKKLAQLVTRSTLQQLLDVTSHIGTAPTRARELAKKIKI